MTPQERRASIAHYAKRQARLAGLKEPAADVSRRALRPPAPPKPRQRRRTKTRPSRVLPLPELSRTDFVRLWSRIERRGPDECWPWRGASGSGYGRFKIGGRLYLPHRIVNALVNGRVEDVTEYHGTVVMHSCDNPSCCNPRHLAAGRQVENVADMFAKGRGHNALGH